MRGPLWAGVAWVMGQVEVAITRVHLEPAPVRAELAIRATREPGDCSRVPGCRDFQMGLESLVSGASATEQSHQLPFGR